MFIFFSLLFFIIIFLELTPFFDIFNETGIELKHSFFWIFLFSMYLNKLLDLDIKYSVNLDLFYKYFLLFFKNPSVFLNYLLIIFKKIFLFLIHFKYKRIYLSFLIFYKRYLNFRFIWWRPLFKKTSYFGYYRSNRSKWIK